MKKTYDSKNGKHIRITNHDPMTHNQVVYQIKKHNNAPAHALINHKPFAQISNGKASIHYATEVKTYKA